MDLSIIIVNWNSADFLLECIASVKEQTRNVVYETIVVDNASADEDLRKLRQHCENVSLITSDENLGFAGANNLGFQHSTGKYVLFLNPDTKLIGPAIDTMVARLETLPMAGIMGCKLLNGDLSVQLSSIQRFPTIFNQLLDLEYLQLRWPHCRLWGIEALFRDDVKLTSVEVISGACMLLPRKVFEEVGRFSNDYFMYAEDIDLNFKVRQAGYSNYYVGEASIIHYGGKSSSQHQVSHWSTVMKYRSMGQLFDKTKGRTQGGLYRIAMGCAAVTRLGILMCVYPMGNLLWKRSSVRYAIGKWTVILQWAFGSQNIRFGDR
jgi:N-acetylglucosaminyl-diphospho-decaprenol L-rhamnosyltransferase